MQTRVVLRRIVAEQKVVEVDAASQREAERIALAKDAEKGGSEGWMPVEIQKGPRAVAAFVKQPRYIL
jgi:hypothetical protein